jgi:hypothetical protein
MPINGSVHISEEVPPGPAVCHQVDSTTGQEASVSNPEEPAPRHLRSCQGPVGQAGVVKARRICLGPVGPLRRSCASRVWSLSSGLASRSSVPDAIDHSETDDQFGSLPAIWARDQLQGPMFQDRKGESVLSEYCGPDPVPLNTGERLAIPGEVRPKSPQKKGEWMSEVPLSESVHDSALLKARQRNIL